MLVVSAVHTVVGWVWHTAYRARWHWRLKREGALLAAAAVAAFGAVDSARSMLRNHSAPELVIASTAQAVTASATPVVTEPQVVAVAPTALPAADDTSDPVRTASTTAVDTPNFDNVAPEDRLPPGPDDPIAAKINERLGDPLTTASIPDAAPAKVKPIKGAKTMPQKTALRSAPPADDDAEPLKTKAAKSTKAPAVKHSAANSAAGEKSIVAKAPAKKSTAKKSKSNAGDQ